MISPELELVLLKEIVGYHHHAKKQVLPGITCSSLGTALRPGLWVDLCIPCGSPWASGAQLLHHTHHHGLQRNLCSSSVA